MRISIERTGSGRAGFVKRSVRAALLAALVATGLPAAIGVPAVAPAAAQDRIVKVGAGRPEQIQVVRGKSETIRMDGAFADLVVGDPDIADVVPLTDKSFYVLGRAVGTTNVSVYDARKQLIGIVDVEVAHDSGRLQQELSRRLPSANIRVSTYNGKIMLSGTVRDAASAEKAMTIAKQFGPDVINSISMGGSQQVMLEVRFVEANRNAGREIGINWNIVGNRRNTAVIGAGALPSGETPFGTAVARVLGGGVTADVLIRGLEERGVARRLAEPNLVALSGDTASFLAGGEYPIPVSNRNGEVTVEFKKFGVGLAFTPTVLDHGMINLKIIPEVSELDYSNPVTLSGVSLPSLIVRRADTTVELRDGQSFAIAGLLQANSQNLVQQLPWIGSVPVLGALFRSVNYQKNETELVIIVTPRLVRPVVPGQVLRTPHDNLRSPSDPELFAEGRTEVRADRIRPPEPGPVAPAAAGHILDLPVAAAKGAPRVAVR